MNRMIEKLRVALKLYPPRKLEKLWYRIFPGTNYTRWNKVGYFFAALVGGGVIFSAIGVKEMVAVFLALLIITMVPTVLIGFLVGAIHNLRLRKIRKWMGISRNELDELLYAMEEENK